MSFKDLPAAARPREKLIAQGAAALGDAELLALLLRTGVAGKNVLQLAQELRDSFGGLAGLLHAGLDDLKRIKGLGPWPDPVDGRARPGLSKRRRSLILSPMPLPPKAIKSLADLKTLQHKLAEQREREAAAAAARAAAEKKRLAEQDLFARAIGATQPLRRKAAVPLAPEPPAPIPVQHQLDEERVLRESLSDEFDVTTLLDADDAMSFRRPGIHTDVTRKLRAGEWSIQRQIDLHGMRSDEAREALGAFIRDAYKQGLRCVRVVHGKGLGSPGRQPVLKAKVQRWLIQKSETLAFVQAKPAEGGAGALLVLLAPARR